MKDPYRKPQRRFYKKFAMYFGFIMAAIYMGFGIFIMFSSTKLNQMPSNIKIIVGSLLIFYGIIRFVRSFQKKKKNNELYQD